LVAALAVVLGDMAIGGNRAALRAGADGHRPARNAPEFWRSTRWARCRLTDGDAALGDLAAIVLYRDRFRRPGSRPT
jgi:hypothetical protein